jgi:uncharacterized protein (TIGR03084 family)
MPVQMATLCDDLLAETEVLEGVLEQISADDWSAPTPAPGWSVLDQVTHLAYFDEAAVRAGTEPEQFLDERRDALAGVEALTEGVARRYREMPVAEAQSWFFGARRRFVDVFSALDPRHRLPWYGPDMSAASAVTARIMETWAHGQDIADAVDVERPLVPAALHQVAHLGVVTMANSFRANGRDVPSAPVRVELRSPDGETWVWGDAQARDVVSGPALDFCFVVTRRRHLADSALEMQGEVAEEWMGIAQAFAGPPGPGRRPGQFQDRSAR